jgi:uncharacterized protein (TIGR03437 family)
LKNNSLVRPARLTLAALAFVPLACAQSSPISTLVSYTAAGVVNSASNSPDALAPNAIATVYGTGLSYTTQSAFAIMPASGMVPIELAGVRVYVGEVSAPIYYVSPTQINFLVPTELRPGDMDFFTTHDGLAGPHVKITLHDGGPGLYPWGAEMIASEHADGSVITKDSPAHPGEVVVVYGTGLGKTDPEQQTGLISMVAAQIQLLNELSVMVAGTVLDPKSIQYAGVTPGIPGLYQVNLVLPKQLAPDPEIRISIGAQISPSGMRLPVH